MKLGLTLQDGIAQASSERHNLRQSYFDRHALQSVLQVILYHYSGA